MFNLLRLKSIRKWFDMEAFVTLTLAIVISHIDYANALFIGLPAREINETATWPHVYQMGHPSRGASNVMGASQGVSPLPNLHNLQLIT